MFKKLKEEIISAIPAVVYFCIAFNLIFFLTGLALPPDSIRYFSHLSVTINSLILGKIIILVGMTPFMNAFPDKPLIYNITWKFFIYTLAVLLFWFIDASSHLYYIYRNSSIVRQALASEFFSPLFLSSLLWIMLVFLGFIIAEEFTCAIGKDKVMRMLFG